MSDARCPKCGRLLARRSEDGEHLEVRSGGRVLAIIRDGLVPCQCGGGVAIWNKGKPPRDQFHVIVD